MRTEGPREEERQLTMDVEKPGVRQHGVDDALVLCAAHQRQSRVLDRGGEEQRADGGVVVLRRLQHGTASNWSLPGTLGSLILCCPFFLTLRYWNAHTTAYGHTLNFPKKGHHSKEPNASGTQWQDLIRDYHDIVVTRQKKTAILLR